MEALLTRGDDPPDPPAAFGGIVPVANPTPKKLRIG